MTHDALFKAAGRSLWESTVLSDLFFYLIIFFFLCVHSPRRYLSMLRTLFTRQYVLAPTPLYHHTSVKITTQFRVVFQSSVEVEQTNHWHLATLYSSADTSSRK